LLRGVPWQGAVVEGVKGVKYAPMPPGMFENGKKRAVWHTFQLINLRKCHFLPKSTYQDILPRCFLRNKLILKLFVT
jgi:hypothetical protein